MCFHGIKLRADPAMLCRTQTAGRGCHDACWSSWTASNAATTHTSCNQHGSVCHHFCSIALCQGDARCKVVGQDGIHQPRVPQQVRHGHSHVTRKLGRCLEVLTAMHAIDSITCRIYGGSIACLAPHVPPGSAVTVMHNGVHRRHSTPPCRTWFVGTNSVPIAWIFSLSMSSEATFSMRANSVNPAASMRGIRGLA